MSNRYSATVSSLIWLLLLGGTLSAGAQSKQDLYQTADAAATAGKIEESQKAYCQVAKMDAKYRDAKMLCAIMTEELGREKKKNEERFNLGLTEFKAGRYDAAQREFANIRWGLHLEEAQQYLKVKIPQARQSAKDQRR
ncbi:MAG: hypothetical protein ABIP81_01605 [Terriglobales bacterium]